ncbi:hypothetical protein; putative signal peptide [Frankia alni ACN14a]|uniref:Uncharacterized protein n=1 Tax=Frankia alni (strain DSM 45986 / CECT 9034 / ACN14a) TaxID=326424 RepID=Q0RLM5_FRAAA|nr:hypothetical protein; putative signal peptide [Frankia alni ACN14a]
MAVLALGAWMAALFSLGFGITVGVALLDRTPTSPPMVSCPSADYHPTIFGSVRPCGSHG